MIRRYIREDKLKTVKVGGEWRIRKEDAEVFIGGKPEEYRSEAMDVVRAFVGKVLFAVGEAVLWRTAIFESSPNFPINRG